MATLADDKWVRVMADFGADGVWAKDGSGVGPEELPVSNELKRRLKDWQDAYDDEDYRLVEFVEEGEDIAREIKAALPDWTVIYFNEARALRKPALDYEYEIRGPSPNV